MQSKQLPADYALVLQQIDEDGSDDFNYLAETLRVDRRRLSHIIDALQHKGLITMSRASQHETWITLSAKGRRLMRYLWPEAGMQPSY